MTSVSLDHLRHDWQELGYIFVSQLIDPSHAMRVRAICDRVLAEWQKQKGLNGGAGLAKSVMRNLIDPAFSPNERSEIIELLELGADPAVLQVVQATTGYEPMFRATSYFFNPAVGMDDGNWHRDSQFLTKTDAEEKLFLARGFKGVQLQIALVPSDDSQYVPRSHLRWDTSQEYHIRKADNLANWCSNSMSGAIRIHLEPGDAVAFNPMGLHRGRYHCDKLRRTYMLTYTSTVEFLRDQFTLQPWFAEPGYLDGLSPTARAFYETFITTFKQDWPRSSQATWERAT